MRLGRAAAGLAEAVGLAGGRAGGAEGLTRRVLRPAGRPCRRRELLSRLSSCEVLLECEVSAKGNF